MAVNPIHEDIPIDQAWQQQRRVYVSCGKRSWLDYEMRAIGAKWDWDEEALWVGSGKKESVVKLVQADTERRAKREQLRQTGYRLKIPYDDEDIRADAQSKHHAIWDGTTKEWVFPTEEGRDEIQTLVGWRNAKRQAEKQEKQRLRAEPPEQRRERLLRETGRTTTGDEDEQILLVSTERMRRARAEEQTYRLGEVVKVRDGRRGLVYDVDVWFTGEAMASSCWHNESGERPHWHMLHKIVFVEPTEQEREQDAEQDRIAADTAEIHEIMTSARRDWEMVAPGEERWTRIPSSERVGVIMAESGREGTLILTRDGRVYHQHPGYYDDYRRSETRSTDAEVVQRVRQVLELGDRKRLYRGRDGRSSVSYTVRVGPTE